MKFHSLISHRFSLCSVFTFQPSSKRRKEQERSSALIEKLQEEKQRQEDNHRLVQSCVKQEKDSWFTASEWSCDSCMMSCDYHMTCPTPPQRSPRTVPSLSSFNCVFSLAVGSLPLKQCSVLSLCTCSTLSRHPTFPHSSS